ncbi:MAG: choice-of-anchor I family protein, partial [Clostridia bacterium]
TPVKTGSSRVPGFFNDTSALITELGGRYNAGAMNADGGSMEIVAYNSENGFAYAVNGLKGTLVLIDLNGSLEGETVTELPAAEISVKALIEKEGFTYGDMTSAAVSPDGSKVAVAVQDENYAKAGAAAVFTAAEDGTLRDPQIYATGVQPDMIVFADNDTILTADEGEPRNGIGSNVQDPAGSVSVINLKESTSVQVGFEGFSAEELTAQNILIGQKDGVCFDPALDLEPEYIAVSADGQTAYISLQEANAIAVLDIEQETITAVCSAGFQDYGKVAVDLTEDGEYNADTYTGLLGARMPDGIALYEAADKTYLLTANEGDAREWGTGEAAFLNESKKKAFTSDTKGLETKIKLIDASVCAGLPEGKDVMFGGRSFTLFEVTENGLTEVFDSGSDFETVTAEVLPAMFNVSNDDTDIDSRSPKKGPEPESVTVGAVGDRTYAFIALERVGGIMIYDITDASEIQFVNYINSREFDDVIQGDVAPEGLAFIAAENTADGKALLLAACEVSGTLAAYTMEPAEKEEIALPFTDVEKEDWFYEDIAFAYRCGLMNGVDSTVFAPEMTTTRGMFVTVLYRLEGTPETHSPSTFSDVPAEAYFSDAVAWAEENDIVNGCGNGHFGPEDAVTREQAATMLHRYARYKGYDVTLSEGNDLSAFADADEVSAYALPAMEWACATGLMQGYDGNLNPAGNTTRAQTAALFHRFTEEMAQ